MRASTTNLMMRMRRGGEGERLNDEEGKEVEEERPLFFYVENEIE